MTRARLPAAGGNGIRALIVVCRYLGDVLLATPLGRSLLTTGSKSDWLVASGTETLLEHQPFARCVFTVDAAMPWRKQWQLVRHLRGRYDIAFVLTASDRSMALARIASPNVHALIPAHGHQYAWKRLIASRWLPYEARQHMVWRAMRMAELAGLPPTGMAGLDWTAEDERTVAEALPWDKDAPYIHLHPFARWRYKWWPDECWRALIGRILDAGLKVAVSAAPHEAGQAGALVADLDTNAVAVLAGRLNWRQLACLAARAHAFIGPDTANTHLAAGAGASVVALFGPTDPRIWGPWPQGYSGPAPWRASSDTGIQRQGNVSLLQGAQDCVPCQLEGCDRRPDSNSACLQGISIDLVWEELQWRVEQTI